MEDGMGEVIKVFFNEREPNAQGEPWPCEKFEKGRFTIYVNPERVEARRIAARCAEEAVCKHEAAAKARATHANMLDNYNPMNDWYQE